MRRALERLSALRWFRQLLGADRLYSFVPPALVVALSSPSEYGRLPIGLICTISSLIIIIVGIIRYIPKIIRELTIRGVIRKVSDEKLPAATGKEFVGMLTKLPDADPATQSPSTPDDGRPNAARVRS